MKKWVTYDSISNILLDPGIKYIWLASWYPSKTDHFNGDFIQRHAESVALFKKIAVIHIIYTQLDTKVYEIDICSDGNLTEIILYIGIKGSIQDFYTRFQYNFQYHFYGLKLIKKILKQLHEPSLIHVHVPLKMGRIAWLIQKIYKIPFLVSEHSGKYATNDHDSFEKRNLFYRFSLKQILNKAISIVHVSKYLADIYKNIFSINNQHIIHNVVDERCFYFVPSRHRPFTFIHVSNLDPVKNFEGIITAFESIYQRRQDFKLIVIGNQDEIGNKNINHLLNHSFLEAKGMMTYQNVANYMKLSDCLILFSYNENFPCVMIEALCCGLPVISTDVGGCKEAINHQNGLLIEKGNIPSLVTAIEFMMDHQGQYDRENISLQSLSKYNRMQIGGEIIELYNKLGL